MGRSRYYDLYRPVPESRPEPSRRPSGQDVSKNNNFWRREQPEERRGRRSSVDNVQSIADARTSPIDQSHMNEQRPRPRANSSMSLPVDESPIARRPSLLHRKSSTNAHKSPISPVTQNSVPAIERLNVNHQSRNINHSSSHTDPLSVVNDHSTMRVPDPRLSRQQQNDEPQPTLITSPVKMPQEEGEVTLDAGHLIRELTSAEVGLYEETKALDTMSTRLTKIENEMKVVRAKLPKKVHAPYTDTLTEEARVLKAEIRTKQDQVQLLGEREESARQALINFHQTRELSQSEVKALKTQLEEERNNSKLLKGSNERLQRQINQTNDTVIELKKLVESLSQELSQNKIEVKANQDQMLDLQKISTVTKADIESIRGDIKQQKLEKARLSDVFVGKDAHRELESRVQQIKALDTQPPVSSDNFLTQNHLDSYISLFNTFETKTSDRFKTLEAQFIETSEHLEQYVKVADLAKQIDFLNGKRKTPEDLSQKLSDIEATAQTLSDIVTTKDGQVQASITTIQREMQELSHRAEVVEQMSRNSITPGFSTEETAKLQKEIVSLLESSSRLDRSCKANSHSIDSLNQRFNNLGTDQLARHMVGVLEPMLATIKPQLAQMQHELKDLHTDRDNIQGLTDTFTEMDRKVEDSLSEFQKSLDEVLTSTNTTKLDISNVETGMTALRNQYENDCQRITRDVQFVLDAANSHEVAKLDLTTIKSSLGAIEVKIEKDFQKLHSDLDFQRKAMDRYWTCLDNAIKSNGEAEKRTKDGLKQVQEEMGKNKADGAALLKQTKHAYDNAMNLLKQEQEEAHRSFVDQVTETRDGFAARLLVVEEKVSNAETAVLAKAAAPISPKTASIPASAKAHNQPVEARSSTRPSSSTSTTLQEKDSLQIGDGSVSKSQNARSMKSSGFLKHFIDEDVDDTIDATPKHGKNVTKAVQEQECLVISDSENDTNTGANEESPDDIALNLDMWTKDYMSHRSSSSVDKVKPIKPSKSNKLREFPVHGGKSVSLPKRKREQSTTTPKSSQASNTDASTVASRKKPKT